MLRERKFEYSECGDAKEPAAAGIGLCECEFHYSSLKHKSFVVVRNRDKSGKVRSLLLATSFPPSHGGIEVYLLQLARALREHDLCALAIDTEGASKFDRSLPFKVIRFKWEPLKIDYWRAVRTVACNDLTIKAIRGSRTRRPSVRIGASIYSLMLSRGLLRQITQQLRILTANKGLLPTDLVHAGTVFPSGIIAWMIHHAFGTPYVIYTHGAELLLWGSQVRTKYLLKRILYDAAWVGAVSNFTAGLVRDLGVSDGAIRIIPPGIDPAPYAKQHNLATVRRQHALADRRVILTHGRLIPRKGHDVVIRALPKLIDKYPDLIYLISGTGPNELALRTLVDRMNLAAYVKFLGPVSSEQLPAIYQICDIFVLPSRRVDESVEGFGIVAIEAAAAGKPVLAARSGGVADTIVDGITGYLIDPENPDDIAARLAQLLGHKELRANFGAAGRQRVWSCFNDTVFARRVNEFVEEAICGSSE